MTVSEIISAAIAGLVAVLYAGEKVWKSVKTTDAKEDASMRKWVDGQRKELFDDMRKQLDDIHECLDVARKEHVECEKDRAVSRSRLDEQMLQNAKWQQRVEMLEKKVESLTGGEK